MQQKEITLKFDLNDEVQNRVYYALKNLPEVYNESDLSKSVILFIDSLVNSIGACEERTVRCEQVLKSIIGPQASGRVEWQ